jgi:predicted kinase
MKNIIIAGASRSGKSTIAKKIAKQLNISYIPFDSIISTVEKIYPNYYIKHYDDTLYASKEIANFLKEFLSHLNYEGINYIIDIYQIKPSNLKNTIDLSNYAVAYIGYPNISLEDKLKAIRLSARSHDWTENITDSELAPIVHGFIDDSITLYNECIKESIMHFDTSVNFHETIEKASDYLLSNLD